MPTARLCLLADVADRIPADCRLAAHLSEGADALVSQAVLHITGDVQLPALHLNASLASGAPLHTWLQGVASALQLAHTPAPFVVFIDGDLHISGALTSDGADNKGTGDTTPHLIVTGNAHVGHAVVGSALWHVGGGLQVDDLLWGSGSTGELRVQGGLQARVALFTDGYRVHTGGAETGGAETRSPEHVEFLVDEVRGGPHIAEFSVEMACAVMNPAMLQACNPGEGGFSSLVDRTRVVAAVRTGQTATRSSHDVNAAFPMAAELCAGDAISIENILALLRTPIIAHKQHTASGWFGQTDFSLCRRHVDVDGDRRDDNVFITVWKAWDFYLSVEQVPAPRNLLERLAGTVLRRAVPSTPTLTLAYRRYTQGQPGEWQALEPKSVAPSATHPDDAAWQACQQAWRGVLDYARKAVGQHRARYPLHQRLQAELTAARIEAFTTLPVFTEHYNDWWDEEKSGYWEGDVWVGARQPCMHGGEPWGRLLKLSWKNGNDAPGDTKDDAHAAYYLSVDEAREGPARVEVQTTQRQSDARTALPPCAADHIARLLRLLDGVEARIRQQHAADQEPHTGENHPT